MGNDINKEKLNQILIENKKYILRNCNFISLKYNKKSSDETNKEEKEDYEQNENNSDSFHFDEGLFPHKLIVKEVNEYPYNSVGTLIVKFSNEELEYTCFLIYYNIVITLASNLINQNGEKAKYIKTTFSNEEIKWENIYIEEEKEDKNNKNENSEKLNNKLAGIIYKNIINEEFLGVENTNYAYFSLNAIISNGYKIINNSNIYSDNIKKEEDKKINQNEKRCESSLLEAEISINDETRIDIIKSNEDKELVKRISGSPMINKDDNGGYYIIAIIDKIYEYHYFNKNNMLFLFDMICKGKSILRKNKTDIIIEDNITKLYLSNKNIGNMTIKYLIELNLEKLTFLDLSKNKITSKGVFYLTKMKSNNLRFLNCNNNEIKDEGLNYISQIPFNCLRKLHLSNTNISYKGIKNLVEANFIWELEFLTLSNNPKISDIGVNYIAGCQRFKSLRLLSLSNTKLTNKGMKNLLTAAMPKLRKLYVASNNINESSIEYHDHNGKNNINYICFNSKEDYQYIEDQKDKEDFDFYDPDDHDDYEWGECLVCKKFFLDRENIDNNE